MLERVPVQMAIGIAWGAKHLVVSLWAWLPALVSMDCLLLCYGFRSRFDLLCGSYEYRYLSVDDNGDRSGYANGTFSATKLGDTILTVTMELE